MLVRTKSCLSTCSRNTCLCSNNLFNSPGMHSTCDRLQHCVCCQRWCYKYLRNFNAWTCRATHDVRDASGFVRLKLSICRCRSVWPRAHTHMHTTYGLQAYTPGHPHTQAHAQVHAHPPTCAQNMQTIVVRAGALTKVTLVGVVTGQALHGTQVGLECLVSLLLQSLLQPHQSLNQ